MKDKFGPSYDDDLELQLENTSTMEDTDDDCIMVESSMQFSVKVEVESCNDSNFDEEEGYDSDCVVVPMNKKSKKRNRSRRKDVEYFKDLGITRYVIDEDEIKKEMEIISQTTTNLADKLLTIELRNNFGRGVLNTIEESAQEKILQNAVLRWRSWNQNDYKFREPPLCYKCYICKTGWWHLASFRDHLTEHNEPNLKIELEMTFHECNFAACLGKLPKYEDFPIEGKCWKCGKTFEEHKSCRRSKYFYSCKLCNERCFTCVVLREHEGICEQYKKALLHNDIQVSYSLDEDIDLGCTIKTPKYLRCHMCGVVCFSKSQLADHMSNRHAVRSDMPTPCLPPRFCTACNDKYVIQNLHPCKLRSDNSSCTYCCRKFQTRSIAMLHMKINRDDILCRVCSNYLPKQCMEMEHLVEHSDNYSLIYKCLLCPTVSYCLSESSIRQHRVIWHIKYDAKRTFYELVLMPKRCIESMKNFNEDNSRPPVLEDEKKTRRSSVCSDFDHHENDRCEITELDKDDSNDDTECQIDEIINLNDEIAKIYTNAKKADEIEKNSKTTGNIVCDSDTNDKKEPLSKEIIDNCDEKEIPSNSNFNCVNMKMEKIDDEYEQSSLNIPIEHIKMELEEEEEDTKLFEIENEIMKVFQASKRFNIVSETDIQSLSEEIHIKEEPIEEDFEDDIIVLKTEEDDSNFDSNEIDFNENEHLVIDESKTLNNLNKKTSSKRKSKHILRRSDSNEHIDYIVVQNEDKSTEKCLKFENSDDHSGDSDLLKLEPEVILRAGFRGKRLYKCHKCGFEGVHKKYQQHKRLVHFKDSKVPRRKHTLEIEGKATIQCTKCFIKFPTLWRYVRHFVRHGYDRNKCPQCLEICAPLTLGPHVRLHIKSMFAKVQRIEAGELETLRAYQCRSCKQDVETSEFFSHWESHLVVKEDHDKSDSVDPNYPKPLNENRLLPLLEPNLLQKVADVLQMPEKVRDKKTVFRQCIVCEHNFNRVSDAKRHLIEHLLVNAYADCVKNSGLQCQICGSVFVKSERYKEHMRDHARLPLYKCELCNKSFGDSSNFSKHKKVHNLQAFICDICNKKFQAKISMERHMVMHMTTEPLQCNKCSKLFYSQSSFNKHKKNTHDKYRLSVPCRLCTAKFTSFRMKWDHLWDVHKIRKFKADCPICKQSFRKFSDVKSHCKIAHNKMVRKSEEVGVVEGDYGTGVIIDIEKNSSIRILEAV